MSDHTDLSEPAPSADRRRLPWRTFVVAAVSVFGLAIFLQWVRGEPMEQLTPQRFREARRQWQLRGPAGYDLEVQVKGRQPAHYRVEVRDGQVVAAYRNGDPLRQRRTLGTWSVPGMFDTIAVDVENVQRVADGKADAGTPHLRLRCAIDPEWGFPARYHRVELVRKGSNPEVSWEVTFKPLNPLNSHE